MAALTHTSDQAARILVWAGGFVTAAGFIALLFDLHPVRQPGFGWALFLSGLSLLVLAFALKQRPSVGPRSTSTHSNAPISTAQSLSAGKESLPVPPQPFSFVSPTPAQVHTELRKDVLSKSITPEILNIRFAAYRCEVGSDQFKAIYQNAMQRELKWYEVSALVIRQFPYQLPWDGKLLLDIVPVAVGGEKVQPVRILSSTYVNYGFLPQGQSASTKENIRRLATFILSQSRSIFIDPGTDCFIHAGQPPERFLTMSQFTEYDSRYG